MRLLPAEWLRRAVTVSPTALAAFLALATCPAQFNSAQAEFYSSNGTGGLQQLGSTLTGFGNDWRHIVPGNFGGDARTDLFFYDPRNGLALFAAASGVGQISQLGPTVTGLRRTWTHFVPGDFVADGGGRTDLMAYDANTGEVQYYATNGGGALTPFGPVRAGYQKTWTHIVPGRFATAQGLLFYDRSSGVAEFWDIADGAGNITLRVGYNWGTDWDIVLGGSFDNDAYTDVVRYDAARKQLDFQASRLTTTGNVVALGAPLVGLRPNWELMIGNFDASPRSDILFYDPIRGEVEFYVSNGNGTISQIGSTRVGWRRTWGLMIPGDFDGNALTDMLLYDSTSGVEELASVTSGGQVRVLAPAERGVRNWWTHIVPGDFVGDGRPDLALYDRFLGTLQFRQPTSATTMAQVGPTTTGIRRSWSQVVAGQFGGSSRADLFFYDAWRGEAEFALSNGNGTITQVGPTITGLDHTWTAVVTGDFFSGGFTDLFFYDAKNGKGRFATTNGNGVLTFASFIITGVSTTWSKIVAGDFAANAGTELFLYDDKAGEAVFVASNGTGAFVPAGTTLRGLRRTWEQIVPGSFGGSSFTDLFFYDPGCAQGETHLVTGGGKMALLGTHASDLLKTWSNVTTTDLNGDSYNELLFHEGNDRVRISVKLVRGPNGRPHPIWTKDTVERLFRDANKVFGRSTPLRAQCVEVVEIDDPVTPNPWYAPLPNNMTAMETQAQANPAAFAWRFDALNFYFTGRPATGTAGACAFPGARNHGELCFVSTDISSVGFAHEIGHYFDLLHTFGGNEQTGTCQAVAPNCAVDGDLVCDTPADPNNLTTLEQLYGSGSCFGANSVVYRTLRHNVMSYYSTNPDEAVLTPQQQDRMLTALALYRRHIVGSTDRCQPLYYGSPTAHSVGTPFIGLRDRPELGATFRIAGQNLVPGGATAVAVGTRAIPAFPLSLMGGLPGSLLLVTPVIAPGLSAGSRGTAELALNVPNAANLVGADLSFQLLDFDFTLSGRYSLPLGHSRGLTVRVEAP